MDHRTITTNKATARSLSASSPTSTPFVVPIDEHWHIYRSRLQVLGSNGMALSIMPGAQLTDAAINGLASNVGARKAFWWTTLVDQAATGLYYAQDDPHLYLAPGTTFVVVTEYVGVNPGSDWTWQARLISTAEPLTNW